MYFISANFRLDNIGRFGAFVSARKIAFPDSGVQLDDQLLQLNLNARDPGINEASVVNRRGRFEVLRTDLMTSASTSVAGTRLTDDTARHAA